MAKKKRTLEQLRQEQADIAAKIKVLKLELTEVQAAERAKFPRPKLLLDTYQGDRDQWVIDWIDGLSAGPWPDIPGDRYPYVFITRYHLCDEYQQIEAWFNERGLSEDDWVTADQAPIIAAYGMRDEGIAFEFRLRWT